MSELFEHENMTNKPMNPTNPSDSDPDLDQTLSDPLSDTVIEDPDQAEDHNSDPLAGSASDYPFGPTPPAPSAANYGVPPQRSGMVRDPYASLGGVASGIAHRYSWDVTLVRLAFVIGLFASFGTAIFFYLIAWAVIPRATVWPPTPVRNPAGSFSSRDIGIGLAVLGALTFLAVGSGSAGSILVPLALVGGGVWLLTQAPRTDEEFATASATSPVPPAPVASFATPPAPIGVPVAPRNRGRKWIFRLLIGFFVLLLLAVTAGAITVATIGERTSDGFFLNIGDEDYGFETHSPDTLGELRRSLAMDNGYIEVDLRDIPTSEWASLEEPLELDITVGRGEVQLKLPESLDYTLSATANNGSIVQSSEGDSVIVSRRDVPIGGSDAAELNLDSETPNLRITVTVDDGSIEIVTDRG